MDSNVKEGLRRLEQAEADLKTSRDCLAAENYYASAFFSQQLAEKAVKGFLCLRGFRALVTCSVVGLLEEPLNHGNRSTSLLTGAKNWTDITLAQDIRTFIPPSTI
ncbi:MAG TPA: HEPN domain-containing protein [Dehalococcoidia bacterium]|nr:HEPN domain-containing protein [Dehalococcoidia bacterium]